MLYMKDEYFPNTDFRELNMWSTQIAAGRSPREQLLGFRFQEACDKFKIKNALALWCYGATKSIWFHNAATNRDGQIRWCEALASEYARLGDIRLMMDLTLTEIKTMEGVWAQATSRLDEYAKFKKPVEPKLPTPIEVPKKKEEEKKPEDTTGEPEKPVEPVKEDAKKVDETTMRKRAIGSIAGAIALFLEWIPLPLPIKMVLKAVFYTIASVFK